MRDFPGLTENDCFAICGNLGHESAGFTAFQEIKPTVAGSAGGWGWAQWTGMKPPSGRRYLFNKWCAEQHIADLKSYEANYGFLRHELRGSEKGAITSIKKVQPKADEKPDDFLRRKVVAFEVVFERAGVKHYDSRLTWAKRARAAYEASRGKPVPAPAPVAPTPAPAPAAPAPTPAPTAPKATKAPVSKKAAGGGLLAAIGAAALHSLEAALVVAAVIAAGFIIYKIVSKK